MASPGVCPVCERRIRKRQDGSGLRIMHYINEIPSFFGGYELKRCKGATLEGTTPSPATIADSKKWGIRCPYPHCGKRVKETADFRPTKHAGPDGKDCRGWLDNKRTSR